MRIMRQEPTAGIVGAVSSPCGSWQAISNLRMSYAGTGAAKPAPEGNDLKSINDYALYLQSLFSGKYIYGCMMVAFFGTMLRMKMVEDIGILDESFNIGLGDDYDYCLRARKAGWYCAVALDVYMYHAHRSTFHTIFSAGE